MGFFQDASNWIAQFDPTANGGILSNSNVASLDPTKGYDVTKFFNKLTGKFTTSSDPNGTPVGSDFVPPTPPPLAGAVKSNTTTIVVVVIVVLVLGFIIYKFI